MVIPYDQLHPATLNALIEEFVTRDGAVHGHAEVSLQAQAACVLRQLQTGKVVILFDEADETCTIVPKEKLGRGNFVDRQIIEP